MLPDFLDQWILNGAEDKRILFALVRHQNQKYVLSITYAGHSTVELKFEIVLLLHSFDTCTLGYKRFHWFDSVNPYNKKSFLFK